MIGPGRADGWIRENGDRRIGGEPGRRARLHPQGESAGARIEIDQAVVAVDLVLGETERAHGIGEHRAGRENDGQ